MRKKWLWILPGLTVLVLDRVVKWLCDGVDAPLIPGIIGLKSAHNTGIAMGLFQGQGAVIAAASLCLAALGAYLVRKMRPRRLAAAALSMIAGGALGNIIDRIALGYVIDMFQLLFVDFYIFNVADAGVVAGAALCAFSLLFRPQDWSDT